MTNPILRANETIEELIGLLHFNAKEELKKNIELARHWLALRFAELPGLTPESKISLSLNEWNKTHGLGLQSVSVEAKNDKDSLLFPVEWKSPTIGFITPGMVEGDVAYAEADFDIDEGNGERVCSLYEAPFFMTRVSREHRGVTDNKETLDPCEAMLAQGRYSAIRTILEMKDPPREKVRNVINRGVYGCQFIKTV